MLFLFGSLSLFRFTLSRCLFLSLALRFGFYA